MFYHSVQEFRQMLLNLSALIDKAVAHAETKKFDVGNLMNARLSPDQFHFIKQVQVACDLAKLAAARLSGKEAPKHEDVEQTAAELKHRLNVVTDYLAGFQPDDFMEASERKIELFFMPGFYLTGTDYLIQFSTPNFYFHMTTAYAILRHNGVDIGKQDYIGKMNLQPKEG